MPSVHVKSEDMATSCHTNTDIARIILIAGCGELNSNWARETGSGLESHRFW